MPVETISWSRLKEACVRICIFMVMGLWNKFVIIYPSYAAAKYPDPSTQKLGPWNFCNSNCSAGFG